jgi:hypothetical protein
MAEPKGAHLGDVFSRLIDAGGEVIRELLVLPLRIVVGVTDAAAERLDEVAGKVRGTDQLQRRVDTLEQRLDSLEKPTTTARAASGRAKPTTATREAADADDGGAAPQPPR